MEETLRLSRCLVVAPNWVGDTVMALPVLDALATADRRISVLAPPHLHPLLRLSPAVGELLEKGRSTRETVGRIRELEFDEAVLLPNSFRAAWIVYRAGIPTRLGYRGDGRALLLRPALHRPTGKAHQQRDYDSLLRAIGAEPSLEPPNLAISESADEQAHATLERSGVAMGASGAPIVGLFSGAEFGPSKRWSLDRFALIAQRLGQLPTGAQPVLLAGPKEVQLVETLRDAAGGNLPVIGHDLDLAGLAALLARLDLLITNDSGPMHIAAAVGTSCVAIFGPTDPRRTSPSGDGHHVLSSGRWCSPCFRRRCPLLHHRCMKEIGVGHVLDAVAKELGGSSRQHSQRAADGD